MTKALSTKNYVLVLYDKSRFFLDEKQAEGIKNYIKGGYKYIELKDNLIMVSAISRIVNGESYEETEKIRMGGFKCGFGEWHKRGEECGHMLIKYPLTLFLGVVR